MRAVLDVNVLVSALISSRGSPAAVVREWEQGAFELVVSPRLLAELERSFRYPKLRDRLRAEEVQEFVERLRNTASMAPDPGEAHAIRSSDPADDYLIALAADQGAALVSGDDDLLRLADQAPIYSPADFLDLLD